MIYIRGEKDDYKGTGLYITPIRDWYYNFQIGFVWKTEEKKTLWSFRINPKLRTMYTRKTSITREQFELTTKKYFPEASW